MPKFLMNRWRDYHIIVLFVVIAIFLAIFISYNWQVGVIGFIFYALLVFSVVKEKVALKRELDSYVKTLTYRVNRAGEKAVTNLPLGILLYDQEGKVQWANPFIHSFFSEDLVHKKIKDICEAMGNIVASEADEGIIEIGDVSFLMLIEKDERLIYFFDVTEKEKLRQRHEEEQTAIAFIYLDNYDDLTQGLEDQVRSRLLSQATSILNKWANKHDILLRRTSTDRFIAILNEKTLQKVEDNRFVVLDEIREQTGKEKVPITLSIGIGVGEDSLREMGELAQSSLDLALGRGGDQVAIKQKNGKVRFYGGKSNAMEKRTRVRARVIAHALHDFVLECDRVVVMGHKNPDMDAIGASIGVLKIAEASEKDGYIVLDPTEINPDVRKLMEEIENHDYLWSQFITPDEANELVTPQTLLVVVDTHKPSLVIEPKLLKKAHRTIVLDHHRRGEEFIEEPVLVYMEPYASSTAELVTELIEYQPKQLKMDRLEATALLAGIIVDTKSFVVRTGARTFDAASYLRSNGADTTLVQKLLREDLDQYVKRAKLVENAEYYGDGITIAVADETEFYSQLLIAQAADTLLTMAGVIASFVISKRKDGKVSISARSLGELNVQLIMEHLGGGGHLTNAAVQLEQIELEEAKKLLQEAIDEYEEGGKKS